MDGEEVLKAHKECMGSTAEGISNFCLLALFEPTLRTLICDYLGPYKFFPLRNCKPLRVEEGWTANECTDVAIRALLVAKVQTLMTKAAVRKATPKTKQLAPGFWYSNEYWIELTARNATQLLSHYRQADAFYYGLPPQGFKHDRGVHPLSGRQKLCCYLLEDPQVTPSEALANVENTLCFIDCQEALEIASYQALQDVFGRRRFDSLFCAQGRFPLRLDPAFENTPLSSFFKCTKEGELGVFGARPVQVGDMTYFKNFDFYSVRNPNGETLGVHVQCIQTEGTQKFTGFGLAPEGVTEGEIYDFFSTACSEIPISVTEQCSPALATYLQTEFDKSRQEIAVQAGMSLPQYLQALETQVVNCEKFIQLQEEYPEKVGYFPLVTRPHVEAIKKALTAVPQKDSPPAPAVFSSSK